MQTLYANRTASIIIMSSVEVPRIRKFVRASHIQEDALDIIIAARPEWQLELEKHGNTVFTFEVLSGGITNRLFTCFCNQNVQDVVVIKLYGTRTDLLIDRNAEIEYFTLLGRNKCGPQLYAVFNNGTCFEFLPGSTLSMATCRAPLVYSLVAKALARFHHIPLQPGENPPLTISRMWGKLRLFLDLLENDVFVTNAPLRNKLLQDCGFQLSKIKQSIDELERILEHQHIPVALCHNDLVLGNVLYDFSKQDVTFVDFEYVMPNYVAYDVANHFVQFVGRQNPDFNKCPGPTFRRAWIKKYLKAYAKGRKCEVKFTQEDFERWVYLCIPAAHLFWGLWGAIQADKSEIEFDYIGYAAARYIEFDKCMTYIRGEHVYKRLLNVLKFVMKHY